MLTRFPSLCTLAILMTACLARPQLATTPFRYETITMTFQAGPTSYTMNFPADGNYYPTGNDLTISNVDTNGFDVYDFCNFYTGPSGDLDYLGIDSAGAGNIVFGPPQEVVGVSCAPTGANDACLPEYSTCEWDGTHGTFLLPCCSGICMATKCRVE